MAAVKKTAPTGEITLAALTLQHYTITLEGDSPLIVHAWSAKAKQEMLDKQQGAPKKKKAFRDPQQDYEQAFYRLEDGRPAFPTIAFKAAVVDAASQVDGITKVFLRGAFHTIGELVAIDGAPRMREDMVRVGMGTSDLRYRPEFPAWSVALPIRLNTAALKLEALLSLFNQAGFSVGVGEWRPQRDGSNGMFHVAGVTEH